ncbi:hypothetical protein NBRC10513v2_006692 [Rhodotorula toruloides]
MAPTSRREAQSVAGRGRLLRDVGASAPPARKWIKLIPLLQLGTLVYKALSTGHVDEEDLMFECGKAYGALLKSLAVPGQGINAPGGFVYVNGKPVSTTFESLSHRQTVGDSSVFILISRQAGARW